MSLKFLIPFAIIAVVVACFITGKKRKRDATKLEGRLNAPLQRISSQLTVNDKLVIVRNTDSNTLKKVVSDFCSMYNKDDYCVLPRVIELTENEWAITFPYGINFKLYSYFINYLKYPINVDWETLVIGWATINKGDTRATNKSIGRKAMFFIPDNDEEHDIVYITAEDNTGYELYFSGEAELLDKPAKAFAPAPVNVAELPEKEYEDFK